MDKKRNVKQITETEIDEDGHRTVSRKSMYYTKNVEEDYVKVYVKTLSAIHDVKGASVQTLIEMLKLIDYNNRIILAPQIKKNMSKSSGLKVNTIEHNLRTLVDSGILIKESTNMYKANPYMFGRGTWEHIVNQREAISLDVTFSEGRVQFAEALPSNPGYEADNEIFDTE